MAYIESDFGQNLGPSSAGAYGYAQFLPGTWASYGGNVPWRTATAAGQGAVAAAGLQQLSLRATGHGSVSVHDGGEFGIGSSRDEALRRALFYYNHARSVAYDPNDAYVNDVLGFALRVRAPARAARCLGRWAATVDDRLRLQTTLWRGPVQRRRTAPPRHGPGHHRRAQQRPGANLSGLLPRCRRRANRDHSGATGSSSGTRKKQLYHRYFHSDSVLVSVGQHVDSARPSGCSGPPAPRVFRMSTTKWRGTSTETRSLGSGLLPGRPTAVSARGGAAALTASAFATRAVASRVV